MKHIFTAFVLSVMLLILCSCGKGSNEPPIPLYEEMTEITMQEYAGDTPSSIEVVYKSDFPESLDLHRTHFYVPGYSEWKQITNNKKLPQRGKSYLLRFTDRSGSITEAFLFEDEQYDYLEIPGKGVWREKKDGTNNWTSVHRKDYRNLKYTQCYVEPLFDNDLSLMEGYNGAEKAILVDICEDEVSDWWDRFIPDEWKAENAEDVRYVFVIGIVSKTYTGYWYNAQTGEKISDAYEKTYQLNVYDLVSGSEEQLYTKTDIFDAGEIIEEYLSRLNSR